MRSTKSKTSLNYYYNSQIVNYQNVPYRVVTGNRAMEDPEVPRTITQDMDFSDLSKLLEGLSKMTLPKKKAEHLEKYFNHFRKSFRINYSTLDPGKSNNDSIFSLARIFLPTEDKKR
ncbi:unnamed protein product, partial [Allacma fusca]